jgi:hypothetical protein
MQCYIQQKTYQSRTTFRLNTLLSSDRCLIYAGPNYIEISYMQELHIMELLTKTIVEGDSFIYHGINDEMHELYIYSETCLN